jgi:hypothetical protein
MRRRRALCSNFRKGKADVELEGRQSDSYAAGAKNVEVCLAEERPIAVRYKSQRLRSGCPCLPGAARKSLPLPDKPSIAVLPSTNMSGDPEQEYFADGIDDMKRDREGELHPG